MKYSVTVQPFVSETGYIEIPDDVKDIGAYVNEHFDDIKLTEDYHDYEGAPMTVRDNQGEIVHEEE